MSDQFDRLGSDEHRGQNQPYRGSDNHNDYGRHRHGHHFMYFELAKRIFQNKTLLMLALALLLIALAVGIWLISLILPLLGQIWAIVEKQGIKGAVEAISPYLLKLWEGTGK